MNLAIAGLTALAALTLAGCPAVTPVPGPEFSTTVGHVSYPVGEPIEPRVLPAATGGSGALTYSLSSTPPGLTFDANDRKLTGTPTEAGTYAVTYEARDVNGKSAKLSFTVIVERYTAIRSIMSSVAVGDAAGVLRFADLPEASDGPAVQVSGSEVFVAGGAVFLDVEPEAGATVDKLLVSIDGQDFGYYEIDLSGAPAPYRLLGLVRFDVDPALESGCVALAAVTADGAVGRATCHPVAAQPVGFGEVQVTVSWDADADLDLQVWDPTGEVVYYDRRSVASGGDLDLISECGADRSIRNEHVAWSRAAPPDGTYEVLLNHDGNCAAEIDSVDYVVRVYNHGQVTTFPGTFTGSGDEGGIGDGREIKPFQVGDGTPQPRAWRIPSRYRGHGDQVFVLNPDGERLSNSVYTLDLGDASAEVYLIATNASDHRLNPKVERVDQQEAVAKGRPVTVRDDYEPSPRPALSDALPELARITEFNNDPPLWGRSTGANARLRPQSQQLPPSVAEGDTHTFYDLEGDNLIDIPATARRVVTDGSTTAAFWVADQDYGAGCKGAGPCVTGEMVDALADRFFRPGAGNDIYDWVTAIYGEPWGPHEYPDTLIPPEATDEVHVLVFDVEGDGAPQPGQCRIVGYFWALHSYLADALRGYGLDDLALVTAERLLFVMDSAYMAIPEGPTWEVTDRAPSNAIATLAHEFQHMIHFYQKPVVRDADSESWLNEMASEVAEDLVADKMMVSGPRGVAYDDPTAGEPGNRRGRLPYYNLFNDIQVTAWDSKIANYGMVYALGAYLARTYGGAELFSEIVQSDGGGIDAVEAALEALGHDVSFGEALADWAVATLLSDNTRVEAPYRYNPGAWETSRVGGQEFRLGSINLFNYRWDPPEIVSECIGPDLANLSEAQEGPYLHSLKTFNERTQPPHSNMFATLGRNTGTVRLTMSAATDNRITVVVKE